MESGHHLRRPSRAWNSHSQRTGGLRSPRRPNFHGASGAQPTDAVTTLYRYLPQASNDAAPLALITYQRSALPLPETGRAQTFGEKFGIERRARSYRYRDKRRFRAGLFLLFADSSFASTRFLAGAAFFLSPVANDGSCHSRDRLLENCTQTHFENIYVKTVFHSKAPDPFLTLHRRHRFGKNARQLRIVDGRYLRLFQIASDSLSQSLHAPSI